MNKRFEAFKEGFTSLTTKEQVNVYNQISSADVMIFSMDEFDEECGSLSPTNLAQRIIYGEFNTSDNYFRFDGNGNLQSLNETEVEERISWELEDIYDNETLWKDLFDLEDYYYQV